MAQETPGALRLPRDSKEYRSLFQAEEALEMMGAYSGLFPLQNLKVWRD